MLVRVMMPSSSKRSRSIHRGGSHFRTLLRQGRHDVLAGEERFLMRLDAGKDQILLLGSVLLGAAIAHVLPSVFVRFFGCTG